MQDSKEKELILKMLENEKKEHNIDVNVFITSKTKNVMDILKRAIQNKSNSNLLNTCMDTIAWLNFNNNVGAYYNYDTNEIKVLFDVIKRESHSKEEYLWNLLVYPYHEFKHVIDENSSDAIHNLHDFYIKIENQIEAGSDYYFTNYYNLYEEIVANKYGMEKASQLIKKTLSTTTIYQNLKPYMELSLLLNEIYYKNYDVQPIISHIHYAQKDRIAQYGPLNMEQESNIIKLLYNEDGTFKTLNTLFKDPNWNNLPTEVKFLIITSKPYLEELDSVNYRNVNQEELTFLYNALTYKYNIEGLKQFHNKDLRKRLEKLSLNATYNNTLFLSVYENALVSLNNKERTNEVKLQSLDLAKERVECFLNTTNSKKISNAKVKAKKLINKKSNNSKIGD